jgi:phenylacetyl-CoA:acceptor oxidoreductase subunit 2
VKPPSAFGPSPWQQTFWDWRAAGNFVCGGAGAGLVVFALLSRSSGLAYAATLLAGLALIGAGLFFVWLEIGRPLRALHVFFNPRSSWMTREAFVAAVLLPLGLAAVFAPAVGALVLLLALAFVYCQSRILQAAKGIPTWREPLLVPLVVLTGLAEGAGLYFVANAQVERVDVWLLLLFAALVVGRQWAAIAHRKRVARQAAPGALAALAVANRVLELAGTWPALIATVLVGGGFVRGAAASLLVAAAGALAALAGAYFKHALITRAGFNQGFALAQLPVRGVDRRA